MENFQCRNLINPQYGIIYLEAMLFAIDQINKDPTMLRGNRLGALSFDLCGNFTETITNAIKVMQNRPLVGVIGPRTSDDVAFLSVYNGYFGKTLISYGATSPDLANDVLFGNLYRTVPSDKATVKVLLDLAVYYRWSYIGVVYSDKTYGRSSGKEFLDMAKAAGICVPLKAKADEALDMNNSQNIFELLNIHDRVKVIFTFLDDSERDIFFKAISQRGDDLKDLLFVGSDKWGSIQFEDFDTAAVVNKSMTIQLSGGDVAEFVDYFMSLSPLHNTRNRWYKPFWEQFFNCTFDLSIHSNVSSHVIKKCSGFENASILKDYVENTSVRPVINAVYAYANTLRNIGEKYCRKVGRKNFDCLRRPIYYYLLPYLLQKVKENLGLVVFPEPFISNKTFRFDNHRCVTSAKYDILNFVIDGDKQKYVKVGTWMPCRNNTSCSKKLLDMKDDNILWRKDRGPLVSSCSNPCKIGEYRKFHSSCCWECIKCEGFEYINNDQCQSCPAKMIPNSNRTSCFPMPVYTVGASSPLSIFFIVISITGLLCAGTCAGLLISSYRKNVIGSLSPELSIISFIGLTEMFAIPFLLVITPSNQTCRMAKLATGVSFAMCYAPLLLQTYILYRQSVNIQISASRRILFGIKGRVAVCVVITLVQVFVSLLEAGGRRHVIEFHRKDELFMVRYCNFASPQWAIALTHPAVIVTLTTCIAHRARQLPRALSELRRIAYTMYVASFVIVTLCTAVFVIGRVYFHSQAFTVAGMVELLAFTNLVGLHVTKLKTLLWPAASVTPNNSQQEESNNHIQLHSETQF